MCAVRAGHVMDLWCGTLYERRCVVSRIVREGRMCGGTRKRGTGYGTGLPARAEVPPRGSQSMRARRGGGSLFNTPLNGEVLRTQSPNTSQRPQRHKRPPILPTAAGANPRCRDASQASGWAHLSTCGQQAEPPAVERWPSTGCRQLVFAVAAPAGIPARLDVSECLPAP